jgi:aspartate/methionine/tyrosine aminotransferase
MWRLNDLFASTPVHAGERLSVIALQQLERLTRLAAARLEQNRSLVAQFLQLRDDLEIVFPAGGTVFFPRLKSGVSDQLCDLLREKYETVVVPGRFFEMPEHFRIGIGCDSDVLSAGLERLSQALDEIT